MKIIPAMALPVSAVATWMTALTAAWLSIGSQGWSLTLMIGAVGFLYLLFPPGTFMPRSVFVLVSLLLLLSLTAFLPANWFEVHYRSLFQDHGIILPPTLSPQPWWTLEAFTLLVATFLWAWICFETQLSLTQRKFLLAGYLLGTAVFAMLIAFRGTPIEYLAPSFLEGAGQFENRNQTGDLLIMGGIFSMSLGFSNLSRQKLRGILWLLISGIFMIAIVRNQSRAAVLLLGLGIVILIALMPEFRGRRRLVQVSALGLIVLGTLAFALVDAPLRDRFLGALHGDQEKRFPIYLDTLSMIASNPWCGIGLGNFEGVFNVERVRSASFDSRCLHPDSDWLWLAAEIGIVGVLLFAALIAVTVRVYLSKYSLGALSRASIAVGIVFLLHSLFDVGGHRLGTVWNCLYLIGLGACRPDASPTGTLPRLGLRGVGLALLVLAALRIQSTAAQPLMPTRASMARVSAAELAPLPFSEQLSRLDRAVGWAPLDWSVYYQRAFLRMHASGPSTDSDADFNRALFLEPNSIELPVTIGRFCLISDLPESMIAWKDLLKRAGPRRGDYLESIYWYDGLTPKSRLQLMSLSANDPDLQVIAIVNQDPSEFMFLAGNFLDAHPSLEGITPALAGRLFDRWVAVGDANEFLNEWPDHPEWQAAGSRAYARALAKAGRYPEAVTTALQQLPAPHLPEIRSLPSLDEAERQLEASPQDPYYLIQLYFAQVAADKNDDALGTLEKMNKLPQCPVYAPYLWAKALASAGQSEAAWRILEPLLKPAP